MTELQRYLGKHIGCRMRQFDLPVTDELQIFVAGTRANWPGVEFAFEIRTDIVELERLMREDGQVEPTLWVGDLTCSPDVRSGTVDDVEGFLDYRWLRVNYRLRRSSPPPSVFASGVVRLGRGFSIKPDLVRAQFGRSDRASD